MLKTVELRLLEADGRSVEEEEELRPRPRPQGRGGKDGGGQRERAGGGVMSGLVGRRLIFFSLASMTRD